MILIFSNPDLIPRIDPKESGEPEKFPEYYDDGDYLD